VNATIEAVRGMHDILPSEQQTLARIRIMLEDLLARYGYAMLDLPVIEHRDLYLRKLGEELVGRVYEFNFGGRDLALRPEWTASVLRAYVTHMQEQPLPLRLGYSGPVFRYERPQRTTYRQFTQVGVELVGGPAPRADAEVLALACAGLDAAGVSDYRVTVGHIGLIRSLLSKLGLAERTQGLLVWGLERLRTQGDAAIRSRLDGPPDDLPLDPTLLEGLDDEQATALLLHTLRAMQVNLNFGTRPPEAIVNRLVRKMRRGDAQPRVEQAMALLQQLSQIRGIPAEVLPQAAALLAEHNLPTGALDELEVVLSLLAAHGLSHERIVLDFGLGRGLQYYTGLIFEIYDAEEYQLCGGGRYDDLVLALGGRQSVPAIGFAYGLERIAAAQTNSAAPERRLEVLVMPVADADYPYALTVAQRLRARDYVVMVDVRGRGVTSNLRDAARRGVDYVAIVGTEERERGELVWRNLHTREEQRRRIEEF
jgi:histidyl-tRNA synthetase